MNLQVLRKNKGPKSRNWKPKDITSCMGEVGLWKSLIYSLSKGKERTIKSSLCWVLVFVLLSSNS